MEIYVIRHTKVADVEGVCYGQSEVNLAETFSEEVDFYQKRLASDFDAVFCSPLQRCQKLAKNLNLGNIQVDSRLMEMNFGDWENQKWDDIDQDKLNDWMQDFVHTRTPNGENLSDLFFRVKSFLDDLREKQDLKKVLLVTHAGVIRCTWAYLLEIPLQNIFKIPVEFGEIFVFRLGKEDILDKIIMK